MSKTPTWFEWLTLIAIVVGPVLALLAQRALDAMREKKKRRAGLYLTLMATRAAPLSPAHVEALNSIDTVFGNKSDERIRAAWHRLLEHMSDTTRAGWLERHGDLKVDLLQEMGRAVGYNFTTDYLKRQIYSPTFFAKAEEDQIKIRQTLAKVLTDEGLKVQIVTDAGAGASTQGKPTAAAAAQDTALKALAEQLARHPPPKSG